MTATVLRFPTLPAEPAVDPAETLETALRRQCFALLADTFGFRFADTLAALSEAETAPDMLELLVELHGLNAEAAATGAYVEIGR